MNPETNVETQPISSPWMLVDDLTVDQAAVLLERLIHWLDGPDAEAASRCARALSLGESDDPETISSWADALAARLRRCAENSQIHTHGWTPINPL
jgi:hypothetical protein